MAQGPRGDLSCSSNRLGPCTRRFSTKRSTISSTQRKEPEDTFCISSLMAISFKVSEL